MGSEPPRLFPEIQDTIDGFRAWFATTEGMRYLCRRAVVDRAEGTRLQKWLAERMAFNHSEQKGE